MKAELQRGRPKIVSVDNNDNDQELYGEDRNTSDGENEGGYDSEGEEPSMAVDERPKRTKLCKGNSAQAAKNLDKNHP